MVSTRPLESMTMPEPSRSRPSDFCEVPSGWMTVLILTTAETSSSREDFCWAAASEVVASHRNATANRNFKPRGSSCIDAPNHGGRSGAASIGGAAGPARGGAAANARDCVGVSALAPVIAGLDPAIHHERMNLWVYILA